MQHVCTVALQYNYQIENKSCHQVMKQLRPANQSCLFTCWAGRGRSRITGLAGISGLGPNSEPRGNNRSFPETRERTRVPMKKIGSRDSFFGLVNSSYNNRNPALGVLWSSHRVASPSIEIPIQIWKKKFAAKLHKSYKKHPCQTSPTASGHFTLQVEPKTYWNNYISMVLWACFSNKVCIYQKTNNQNGGCYDHWTHEITLAGSHSLHWGRVQWKIPCLRAKRFP